MTVTPPGSGRAGPYFVVSVGTRLRECRSCGHPVYWIITEAGKRMPVDCVADDRCVLPTSEQDGLGLSHFATCPQAAQWRSLPAKEGA